MRLPAPGRTGSEPPEVADHLQRLVRRLDGLAVHLKRTLRLDELDQFLHRVDVRGLEKLVKDHAEAALARRALDGRTGRGGLDEDVLADGPEPAVVGEVDQPDLPEL